MTHGEVGADKAPAEAVDSPEDTREEPDGSWLRGTYLLCTSTSQPTLLGLPFAMAAMGFPGGTVVLVIAGLTTVYCNILLAALFNVRGLRHTTYRHLSQAVCGDKYRYAYHAVLIPQFVIVIGVGVANLILAGQCLQAIYAFFCDDSCEVRKFVWTYVAAGALMMIAQLPRMSHAEVVTLITTVVLVFYSVASMVLAGIQGGGKGADYSIPGNSIDRWMNGFNAVGIVVFTYTNNIVPEIQATLRPDPVTRSSYQPMRRAIVVAYALIAAIYISVSLVGYWAYGNTVSGFLLAQFTAPKGLITTLNIACVFQLLVGEQVFEWVLYDSWEAVVVARFPRATWLHTERRDKGGSSYRAPSRLCMLLVRIPYIALIATIAAAFPFFSEVMGLVGAVGLTPLCFIFPVALYLLMHGRVGAGGTLSVAVYWANAALAALFTVVGILASIGSVRSIVVAIQQHDFFS